MKKKVSKFFFKKKDKIKNKKKSKIKKENKKCSLMNLNQKEFHSFKE